MRLKKVIFLTGLFFVAFSCLEEPIVYEDPVDLVLEDFTFIPRSPYSGVEVSMVYYGCEYNETSSVTNDSTVINVVKTFNGAMKRPCILALDTVPLGILEEGKYTVTLEIIDINPFATDSLFYTESKTLVVGE